MADRTEELRGTAAQCLALARSTSDQRTRAALITMAQKLHEMGNGRPQQPAQQQQQIQPKKKED
jgi:hypothetical protein